MDNYRDKYYTNKILKGFLHFSNVFFSNPQSIFIGHNKP